jgi:TctA family transporter
MNSIQIFLVFLGGFIGSLLSIISRYGIKNKEFSKAGNYFFAIALSFAIYGIYSFFVLKGYLPETFSNLALFGIAVFIGFSIDELARVFWQILKKED